MAIKDSIVNLKKGLRTTLTNVPALIDTLVRGLDGVAEAAEDQITYSTDERVIGKWIDGSELYEKIINFGKLPNATTKSVDHGITFKEVISFSGVATTENDVRPIPSVSATNYFISLTMNKTQVSVLCEQNFSTHDGYITVRYTKPSASRSPEENDTKNGGNEENEEVKNER